MAHFLPGAVDSSNHEIDNSPNTTGSVDKIKVKVMRPRAAISLIFTHGGRGGEAGMESAGMASFGQGFAKHLPLLIFAGSQSSTSLIAEYKKTMEVTKHYNAIGGRGPGGRAAASCADETTKHLALVSYPLRRGSEIQDAELLALPRSIKVIFLSGDRDELVDVDELDALRKRMKAQSWRVIVRGADHDMRLLSERGTRAIGMEMGEIVAEWLTQRENNREGELRWHDEEKEVEWSGWVPSLPLTRREL